MPQIVANPSPNPPPEHSRFKPGQTGNPGGKPVNARNRLTAHFLNRLADDFEEHGKQAIVEARTKDPMGYIKAIGALMPKQIEQTQPLDDLNDTELLAAIAFLRSRLTDGAGTRTTATPELPQAH
jgi:hypothetical protein